MYTSGGAERPSSVLVDAMLWQYMQKAGGQWATELADVRDRMGVLMSESATDDGQVALTLAGVDDDVAEATDRVRSLLDRGRAAVSTVDVVCPDAAVRAKLMRFSDHLNKSPAYVCVQADGRMTVTGTTAELDECRVKLTKLGASLPSRDQGATTETAGGGHDDEPVPNSPWSDLGSGRAGPPQDLAEDERIARQLQQQEHAQHTQFLRPGGGTACAGRAPAAAVGVRCARPRPGPAEAPPCRCRGPTTDCWAPAHHHGRPRPSRSSRPGRGWAVRRRAWSA